MKSLIKKSCFVVVFLLMILSVLAVKPENPGKSDENEKLDVGWSEECAAHFGAGYYGIAKWEPAGGGTYELKESFNEFHGTSVTGDDSSADWTAAFPIEKMLVKGGQDYQEIEMHPGEESGTVTKGDHGISHITFCYLDRGSGCVDCTNPVPEFSTVTLALVILGGSLGLAILRKD